MIEPKEPIIVGILGQYASGKSAAARTLVQYLGGEDQVIFITDRELVARQAVQDVLGRGAANIKSSLEADGRRRLDGEHATVWLRPGEDLGSVDLDTLRFDMSADFTYDCLQRSRIELGRLIGESAAQERPIVIEAGYGQNPSCQSLAHLFACLEEAGAEPRQVRWILIKAAFDIRAERNRRRRDKVPVETFAVIAADGGDLDPEHQRRLEAQGTIIRRVPNEHDDLSRFRADIIATFEELFGASRSGS